MIGYRYPPGVETLFTDRDSLVAPMIELYDKFAEVKQRWLRGRQYWYMNLIARHPERRDQGELHPQLKTSRSAETFHHN